VKNVKVLLASTLALSFLAASPAASAQHKLKNSDCLACHSDATLTKEVNGKPVSLFVDENKFKHSIHGSIFSCVDCHKDVKATLHETPPAKVRCAECHADSQQAYEHSLHSKNSQSGTVAANCEDCHGGAHEVMAASDAKSPVNRANIPGTCGRCHGQKFLMESNGQSTQPFVNYQESVHGRASEKGDKAAAVCTDCHGTHSILPAKDADSPINKFNVPNTCGKCHNGVEKTYLQSIHGKAVTAGNDLAPTCTDCHGIHSIKAPIDPNSSVSEQNLARTTCARCHESVRLSQEFGVSGNRVSTYLDSYHGLASEGGSVVVANCASCHGVHNILPSSDPNSTINHANLDKTCGQCHKGVTQRFTQNKVHVGREPSHDISAIVTKWIRLIYIPLIILVIGAMLLHNLILWRSKALAIRRSHMHFVQRMTDQQRWQHLVLLSSFIILVITGFALKFPTSWFAEILGMGEKTRSIIHRVAGVVLIGAGIYHVFYLAILREGRQLIRSLAPAPKDAFDIWTAMRFHLGLSKVKPQFGRFNYAEKAEYWALVWGTALMAVTGIMIWANVWVGNLLARWWVDAATAVHFYEAILATLAILVWHFYQVFFDPDVYPMNWAWWDGKMTTEHYKEEHPLDKEVVVVEEKPSEKGEKQ
jgi:cytochrome b subunit of formate dehydrogenase/nitrate/TMAO reductase-like tetraheme cytochrome c subunit